MSKPVIRTSKNGPYVVQYAKKLTESRGSAVEIKDQAIALCRCGQSKNKPFCDGTHGKIQFDSRKKDDRVPRLLETYIGKEIIIHDDRGICSHAGYCTDGLPKVFRMGIEPWIDPDGESMEKIIETIEKCPSGALSYTIDGVKVDDFSKEPTLEISEDGPYYVGGDIELIDEDHPQTMNHYALCRCGHSTNKPFCNGQHWYKRFEDKGLVAESKECTCSDQEAFDNKVGAIQNLARTGKSENSAMRTQETFLDFKSIMFKGAQLDPMPLNGEVKVDLTTIIGKQAKKPLVMSIPFYVSHMSFGAISREAKIALAKGTSLVDTAMSSGEGGMLPESRAAAKTYIYELGTAAFSHDDQIIRQADAVEIKIGQAVKPGLGGHLPIEKITPEIAKIRGLKAGEASVSPGRFSGVDTIEDLIEMVAHIRQVTGGVPVGIKFSAGHIEADLKQALQANPDFITIDCRGGATGSSPKFLKDNVGVPAIYAITRARKYLDLVESKVSLCITGGFRDAADIAKGLALGADAIALATASLIAIGCMQSKVCHTGTCPAGIATQDENLRALFDEEKALLQFQNFYSATAKELQVFARSNGKDCIHDLNFDDLVTDSSEVSRHTDLTHM
ncbi:hypothetical protein SANA_08150 [Gottschalkiaceae bacterium SANA]|nr:hypothetical protein SANA_08150 [Gottschalkiaceae bacterium SANA]